MSDGAGLVARVALASVAEPGDAALWQLVRRLGPEGAVGEFESLGRSRAPDLDAAERRLALADARDVRLVVPGDLGWPTQLYDLAVPPLLLWVRGTIELRQQVVRSVSVVGARAATAYGKRVAENLGAELASRGYAIVSGGAYGIDSSAHLGAIAGGGATVAVLACGVDVSYPPGNESLFDRILESGVLISEVPLGAHPRRGRFLVRNRVIAALTRATVVVEAAHRSGALNTAAVAAALPRPVFGVPGPVDSACSAGVHRLLREGATLVTCADEVDLELSPLTERSEEPVRLAERPRDRISGLARSLLEVFPARTALSVSELSDLSGLTSAMIRVLLTELSAVGLVRSVDDCWSLTAKARA